MELQLAEEFLLIGLNDEKGSVEPSAYISLDCGLTGAVLLELTAKGAIDISGTHLKIQNPRLTGNPASDAMLAMLQDNGKPRTLTEWINLLTHKISPVKELLLTGLVEKGVLEKTEGKFLWIFKTEKYPTKYSRPEEMIRKRLSDIVLAGKEADERSITLLALIGACRMTDILFREKQEKKIAEKRIQELTQHNIGGQAVARNVQDIYAALCAANAAMIAVNAACYSS